MRLLHTSTLQLVDFPSNQIPDYAILSHTWQEDEVLFADMLSAKAREKKGYEKVRSSCEEALRRGLEYIWIDTCCINKDSSAELSEAINSMYKWYEKAIICFAYLADVPADTSFEISTSALTGSRWFQRGWTLQELIAPSNMNFFSCDWTEIGSKLSLRGIISTITGINEDILAGVSGFDSASVAKRMSWASRRITTRIEDSAYCLMGLFEVNMPMLYGEGEKAFLRLQEEIIKNSDDQSLFPWIDPKLPADSHHGLFANSPACFAESGDVFPYCEGEASTPYSVSNKGLRIELHLRHHKDDLYFAALRCPAPPDYVQFLGIYVKRVPTGHLQYTRVKPQSVYKTGLRGKLETLYVRSSPSNRPQDFYPTHVFQLRNGLLRECELVVIIWYSGPNYSAPPAIECKQKNAFDVGFDVTTSIHDNCLSKETQKIFSPKAPGTCMELGKLMVCVNVQPQMQNGIKYYLVDLVVEPTGREPSPQDGRIAEVLSSKEDRLGSTVKLSGHRWKHSFPWKDKQPRLEPELSSLRSKEHVNTSD
ncbi:uncharacterized protein KY384_004802 [Bacidia gigantensis]|uniref:uncharacterized protein n=1 Tax=Bacidia gigantensis TaxID=2732470 RepID=UPI001D03FC33|nr:uncharacterized protein KY384_004802 [Bacidia gigantensis]KAG8530300.1 hypothetical protein KY384_004802 [Bacidia gigantensis]